LSLRRVATRDARTEVGEPHAIAAGVRSAAVDIGRCDHRSVLALLLVLGVACLVASPLALFMRRTGPLALISGILVGGGLIGVGLGSERWAFLPVVIGTVLQVPESFRRMDQAQKRRAS
jgi:hypothetical protein